MRRRLALAVVCAMAAISLVACSKPSTSNSGPPESTEQDGIGTLGEGPSQTPTPTPTGTSGPSQPQPKSTIASKIGFAWIQDGATAGEINTAYQYNAGGGAISVAHDGAGRSTVTFAGLGSDGGVAHAQAYGSSANFCNVAMWYRSGSDQNVGVRCYTPAGAPADTPFTVNFAVGSMGSARFSYLWADQPTNDAKYKPDATYAYDAVKSADVTVDRTNVGRYDVFLPASGPLSAFWTFQVTGYGSTPTQCKLAGFNSGTRVAKVACRNAGGGYVDTQFALTFASGASLLGRTDRPHGAFSEENDGLENPATGVYVVRATNLGQAKGQVVAVARGGAATYCHIEWWDPSGADLSARVLCFNPGGAPASSGFELAVTL